jgi:hypothetical protein
VSGQKYPGEAAEKRFTGEALLRGHQIRARSGRRETVGAGSQTARTDMLAGFHGRAAGYLVLVEKSVRELIAELARVEDEIRRLSLHERGGLHGGRFGGAVPGSSGWLDSHAAELQALRSREDELCRELRSLSPDAPVAD